MLLASHKTQTHLCYLVVNDFFVSHIALVADEQLIDTLRCISVNFLQPLLDIIEAVHIGDVVDHADTVGATIVR